MCTRKVMRIRDARVHGENSSPSFHLPTHASSSRAGQAPFARVHVHFSLDYPLSEEKDYSQFTTCIVLF